MLWLWESNMEPNTVRTVFVLAFVSSALLALVMTLIQRPLQRHKGLENFTLNLEFARTRTRTHELLNRLTVFPKPLAAFKLALGLDGLQVVA
jgi:hypothetical protein